MHFFGSLSTTRKEPLKLYISTAEISKTAQHRETVFRKMRFLDSTVPLICIKLIDSEKWLIGEQMNHAGISKANLFLCLLKL